MKKTDSNLFNPVYEPILDSFNTNPKYYEGKLETIALGYLEAAKATFEKMCEETTSIDYLVFPYLFLYRHYFEIQLKRIQSCGNYIKDRTDSFDDTHSLQKLWEVVKPLIEFASPETNTQKIVDIESNLMELHKVDPNSMAFRYSIDRQVKSRKGLIVDTGNFNIIGFESKIKVTVQVISEIADNLMYRAQEIYDEEMSKRTSNVMAWVSHLSNPLLEPHA